MDGQRNFPDEQESRWFPEQRDYAEPDWRNRGDDRYPSEGFRAPDAREPGDEGRYGGRTRDDERYEEAGLAGFAGRHDESPYAGHSAYSGGDRGARPAAPGAAGDLDDRPDDSPRPMDATGSMPPVATGHGQFPHQATQAIDGAALRRNMGPGDPAGDGVYRSRRPLITLLIVVLTIAFEIPALRLLLAGAVANPVSASGVVSGTLMVLGLPIFAVGLRALAGGAGSSADPARFWIRPPTAYLTVGFALLVAAAMAAA